MTRAEPKDEAAAAELLYRCGLVGEQIRMAQVDVGNRRAEHDALRMHPKSERARERIVVGLSHEDAVQAGALRHLRPFDKGGRWTVGQGGRGDCDIRHVKNPLGVVRDRLTSAGRTSSEE